MAEQREVKKRESISIEEYLRRLNLREQENRILKVDKEEKIGA